MSWQLITCPIHFPNGEHDLVTFPFLVAYPYWQPSTQFAPKVFPQNGVKRTAFKGTLKGPHLTAVSVKQKNLSGFPLIDRLCKTEMLKFFYFPFVN